MKKKRTLYLVHHSHTDIGYTDRQEKISRYHVDFIKSVIRFLDSIEDEHPEWHGFNYTCENFWQVEQFLENSTKDEQAKFETYVRSGQIDISLSYLNMTELVDDAVLNKKFAKAKAYVEGLGVLKESAMTADINGYSWGYAETMAKNGIKNLYSCVHTHHGMFPLFKKQQPFWWQTESGEKLLVWNGDHYQTGNDFLLVPNSDQSKQYGVEGYTEAEADLQFAETERRIFAHFDLLDEEGYQFNYVPAMISGIVTDNAPPNPRMMEVIHRWNAKHGQTVELVLVTLDEFFNRLRKEAATHDFPTYSGDWTDWWADGVGSTPAPTKIYRDAQHKYRVAAKLVDDVIEGRPDLLAEGENQLMMYAEHTWGYHSSVAQPWNTFVNDLDYRKAAYAINANSLISRHLDDVLASLGEESIQMNREPYYKIINPHESVRHEVAKIYVKHWETVDDSFFSQSTEGFCEVVDCQTGEVIDSQVANSSLGKEVSFNITLKPKEHKLVRLRRVEPNHAYRSNWNHAHIGTDRVEDVASYLGYEHHVTPFGIETDHFIIELDEKVGISSLIDKQTGEELLHPERKQAPFAGVYERTPIKTDACTERRLMGRNRKGRVAQRYDAKLKDIQVKENGCLYSVLEMSYELEGTGMYTVSMRIYKNIPRIDVTVRISKNNEWAPENLYIPLPFKYGADNELYIEKSGTVLRPAIDQLPGTNTEFYLLDNGLTFTNGKNSLVVALKDTPLITLGGLESHPIELCQLSSAVKNNELVYSWPMNNFWETNFKVDLAGFYEFRYSLFLTAHSESPEKVLTEAAEVNEGILTIDYNPSPEELG
ncbi:hypothetical protein OL233_06820 [Vagococcus sp. PNs007]|uniref:Glycoside hydrolase family 38 N-terminal domain-containing protein n=1 Tax=Vagococcus proximus TaxID=2991417 RepID=A0ABT5X1X6_9ENTE|nr:glycoside hydrolase family 38 C-terminal domain-containing protein [Vagococcus proximus]MDF0480003.1 hypothetical protein [Vagococcus proximus]